jgi:peptidoglycan/xylan/chitin deacetylase (PgdA/CDA1 family)
VKATFFLVGEMAHAHPATVRRIFAEGHTIGTHSEDHPSRFGKLPRSLVEYEIDKGIIDVGVALGDHRQVAPFFRVPGLARSEVIDSELAARQLVSVQFRYSSGRLAPAYLAKENHCVSDKAP